MSGHTPQGAEVRELAGNINKDCCDFDVPVAQIFSTLDNLLRAPYDTGLLPLLLKAICPRCHKPLSLYSTICTLSSRDCRRLEQRIVIATARALDSIPSSTMEQALSVLLANPRTALTSPPWANGQLLVERLADMEACTFADAHGCCPFPNTLAAAHEFLSESLAAKLTLKSATHGVALLALLMRFRALSIGTLTAIDLGYNTPAAKNARAASAAQVERTRSGVGYGGDSAADAAAMKRAVAESAAAAQVVDAEKRRVVIALDVLTASAVVRDEFMPTFMLIPHAILAEGGLAHVLQLMLANNSPTELANSSALVDAQLKFITAVALNPSLESVLKQSTAFPACLTLGVDGFEARGYVTVGAAAKRMGDIASGWAERGSSMNEVNEEGIHVGVDRMNELVTHVQGTADRVQEAVEDAMPLVSLPPPPEGAERAAASGASGDNGGGDAAGTSQEAQRELEATLSSIGLVKDYPLMDTHAFRQSARGLSVTSSSSKQRMRTILNNVAGLESGLTYNWDSSVHVAVDPERPDLMRVLVLPSQETPYANGVFVFDLFLPADFPTSPPKMKFLSTGSGKVRFNPNLYHCGKVCLSLLGTWSGPSWDPEHSTILQLLLSLQAMVFCPDPFYNEPGYERQMNTEQGNKSSSSYNDTVRRDAATHCMLEPLQHPLSTPHHVFRDVLKAHWLAKRDVVKKQLAECSGVPADLREKVCSALDAFEQRLAASEEEEAREKARVEAEERERQQEAEFAKESERLREECARERAQAS